MCILFDPSNSISKNLSYRNSVQIQRILKIFAAALLLIAKIDLGDNLTSYQKGNLNYWVYKYTQYIEHMSIPAYIQV